MPVRVKPFVTPLNKEMIVDLVDDVFGDDLHAKRVLSLSNAAQGAIASGSLAIHTIGVGLAQAQELDPKHCIKQVDRLLSNKHIVVWDLFDDWVTFVLGERKEIFVILDWTDFQLDGHTTLVLTMVTGHGRGTPLIWTSVPKERLKNYQTDHEDAVVDKLRKIIPEDVKVTIIADRGFSDTHLFKFIREIGFHYIIRIRDNFEIRTNTEESMQAFRWAPLNRRTKSLKSVQITHKRFPVEQVVFAHKKEMKEAWYLATSRGDLDPKEILVLYGKRWGTETVFRDIKDLQFGMGMKKVRTKSTERRDRLFLISALAIALLVLLGAAGEAVGLERKIKANTVKTRSYSLWRQGCMYYLLLPGMKAPDATLLINKFQELLAEHRVFKKILGIL